MAAILSRPQCVKKNPVLTLLYICIFQTWRWTMQVWRRSWRVPSVWSSTQTRSCCPVRTASVRNVSRISPTLHPRNSKVCYDSVEYNNRAESRLAPSQWETLQNNAVSHWLGTNLESALYKGFALLPSQTQRSCDHSHWFVFLSVQHYGKVYVKLILMKYTGESFHMWYIYNKGFPGVQKSALLFLN